MTRQQKLDSVVDLVCKIIRTADDKMSDRSMKRVIFHWLTMEHLDLSTTPVVLIEKDYPRLINYLNCIYDRYKNYNQMYMH